ncbi:MAG: glucose-6-phosphate isomerase [Acetobacteraceae bacterium]|nr:glucose-6-phosphate isomerase [Acetobacteraceae bacterium]
MALPSTLPQWQALAALAAAPAARTIRDKFAADPARAQRFTRSACGIRLDFSKTSIDADTLAALLALARAQDVAGFREKMFAGAPVNGTERRAALHVALRGEGGFRAAGEDASAEVAATLARMRDFVRRTHEARHITDVVNIGIGGSDLGPAMVVRALATPADPLRAHFVGNVDGAAILPLLEELDPARTLVLIASKTFTTQETMANAAVARAWIADRLGESAVGEKFCALSTNARAVAAFGIPESRTFGFRDWVGGRFSLWSAIGLSIALALGWEKFAALLQGARAMDEHFRAAPDAENLPLLMALVELWHATFLDYPARAVLAYDQRLSRFAAHLQQLEMESLGKRVTVDGNLVGYPTGTVVFGEPGTNAQHSFMQLVHQGPRVIPVDFLLAAVPGHSLADNHRILAAHAIAQSEALLAGKTEAAALAEMLAAGMDEAEARRLAPHRAFPGERPSLFLLYRTLDARTLGALVALYEHKVASLGALWGINPFDQWGVELGKALAGPVLAELAPGAAIGSHDASTVALIASFRNLRGEA